MSYFVKWRKGASRKLAAAWIDKDSSDQKALTAISHDMEQRIRILPWSAGESRIGTTRTLIDRNVQIYYDIIEDDHLVRVTDLRILRTPLG